MIPTYLKVPFSMKCSIHVFGLFFANDRFIPIHRVLPSLGFFLACVCPPYVSVRTCLTCLPPFRVGTYLICMYKVRYDIGIGKRTIQSTYLGSTLARHYLSANLVPASSFFSCVFFFFLFFCSCHCACVRACTM